MIRLPNLVSITTAIDGINPALEALLRGDGAPLADAAPATADVADKRTAEIDAVSRHARVVLQATERRKRARVQSSVDQVTALLDEARQRDRALAGDIAAAPEGSLIGGGVLIAAAAVLLAVEYFLVVSVVPPALGLRPGSLPAMAMAGVAPLAMIALEPFVDRLVVAPFAHRHALGRLGRIAFSIAILVVGAILVAVAIRVVTANATLRQEYARVMSELLKHRAGAELSPATVHASVLAISLLALFAAPFLCSFGHHSVTGGYRRWTLRREQRGMRQLALAASMHLADGRSHLAMLAEPDPAREEAESVEAVVRARALRALTERTAAAADAAEVRRKAAETPPAPVVELPRAVSTDRQLYEQILRRRRDTLDADLRKAS